jgi:hypothetical protein
MYPSRQDSILLVASQITANNTILDDVATNRPICFVENIKPNDHSQCQRWTFDGTTLKSIKMIINH